MKVIATATGESVISKTKAISASWLMRSPNRLMTWPTQSAENEPLRARRTYGWFRASSRRDGRARGTATVPAAAVAEAVAAAAAVSIAIAELEALSAGYAMPTLPPPSIRGRSRTDASSRPGDRPVPWRSTVSETCSPGGKRVQGAAAPSRVAAVAAAVPSGAATLGRSRVAVCALVGEGRRAAPVPVDRAALAASIASRAFSGTLRTVEKRKKDRPAVRNRSPIEATFWNGGSGSGIRSPSGPRWRRNSLPRVAGRGVCRTVPKRPGQPGRLVGREPHRHVPAVDHDHERVARDADEREREARVGAVLPQRDQQQAVRQAEEREPQLVDDRDVVGEEGLGPEAKDHAEEQERQEPQPDVRQPLDPPAQQQAEQQPERDSGDQHAVILRPAEAARPSIASRRGPCVSRRSSEAGRWGLNAWGRSPNARGGTLNAWRSLQRSASPSTVDLLVERSGQRLTRQIERPASHSAVWRRGTAAVNAQRSSATRADRATPDPNNAKRRDQTLSSDPPSSSPTPTRSRHGLRAAR